MPPAGDDWPLQDLEAVKACPVCGETGRRVLHADQTDRVYFCAPGRWTLYRCDRCASAYLDPRPNRQSIGRAYASYYTHEKPEERRELSRKASVRWRDRCGNGYLNARSG